MATLWDPSSRAQLLARIRKLSPDSPGKWGRMNARQMLAHITDAGKMALGEITAKSKKLPIRYPPLRELFIYVLPFPRNAPTAPELLGRTVEDWPAGLRDFEAVTDRLVSKSSGVFPEHPAFGNMGARAWGVLIYRHTDHHLRQFGQ